MKSQVLYLLLGFSLVLLISENSVAQTTMAQKHDVGASDTTNIARQLTISMSGFDSLVNKFVDIMEKRQTISTINDYIILVRLVNTVTWGEAFQKKNADYFNKNIYGHLIHLFKYYFEDTVNKLHARRRKGLEGYYSSKYDIGIGTSSYEFIQKDIYHIL